MNEELNLNRIAAEFLSKKIDGLLEGAKSVIKEATDKLRLRLDKTYSEYLTTLLEKYSQSKSFFLRGEAVPLHKFYVPLSVETEKIKIQKTGVVDILNVAKNSIMTGLAGCGKSMLVRHLLVDSILSKVRVPLFIELRHFNDFKGDLFQLIMRTITTSKFKLDDNYVSKAINLGHFILFLDGYDEVAHARRHAVRSTIQEFVKLNDMNAVIITSRPDPELEGWQDFTLFRVCPLTLQQAHSLVEKLPFNVDLKSRFLTDLNEKLFKEHEDFLSNPLLLSIMLLSYGQSASIPNKLSVFYNQAYEALFERHDVLKNGFKRHRLTPLDIQDFARIYSAFSIQAYDKRKLEFTQLEALEYIEESIKIVGISCNKQDYLTDLIQAVSLMVQDGLHIVYAHRSFQEYFSARFICESNAKIQKQLINKYMETASRDSVFSMLYEMRPEIIEQYYLIPEIDRLFKKIGFKKSLGVTHHERFIRSFAHKIRILSPGELSVTTEYTGKKNEDWWMIQFTMFAISICGHLVGWKGYGDNKKYEELIRKWKQILKKPELDIRTHPQAKSFIRDLAKTDGWLSLKMLKLLLQIKKAIEEKSALEEKTLQSILNR